MEKIILASKNMGKVNEIRDILSDFDYEVVSMQEAGINCDVEENGTTFEENALLKAREIAKLSNCTVIADDSGLEIDYLNGDPGIYTARYAGEGATDAEKNQKVLNELAGVPMEERGAKFVCCMAVVFSNKEEYVVRGECNGFIAEKPIGENGFGYDPIFYVKELGCTTAQLSKEEKNKISHRGKALRELKRLFINL